MDDTIGKLGNAGLGNDPSDLDGATPESIAKYESALPETLDYTGEFGTELVIFLPFMRWLSTNGVLRNRRIRTYRGMRCFYDDLNVLEIIEKDEKRIYVPRQERPQWLPVKSEHDFDGLGPSRQHDYPDLRGKFQGLALAVEIGDPSRPMLIIHNKHNDEWDIGPVNHISLAALENIFLTCQKNFNIVYVRHGIGTAELDFSDDHNATQDFNDRELLRRYPDVTCFDDLYKSHIAQGGIYDLNTFKNIIYSRCYHFISSQGGGAHHIALFSGSLFILLHRFGLEERWAYRQGYYSFMAVVPPVLAVCRTEDELSRALPLLDSAVISEGRVLLSAGGAALLSQFSPETMPCRHPLALRISLSIRRLRLLCRKAWSKVVGAVTYAHRP